ncbi:MAG: hypothetical protein K8T20_02750 [Planctomycetes bacterium]|nr:hypothetical protein [Planctomycetota bacterium]
MTGVDSHTSPAAGGFWKYRASSVFGIAFAVYALVAIATGDYLNEADSDARVMGAEYALDHPAWLLDPWHKPVLTTLIAGVVLFGGGVIGVKLVQAALAAAALALVRAAAVRFGAKDREALLAAALAGLAPFWVRGVASALTETSCALFLALALWLWSREKFALSALATSFAFLARFDAVFFWVAWTPFLFRKRSWAGLASLPVAPILWHLAGWAATGNAKFLFANQPHPWGHSHYGSGPWWTFLRLLPVAAGAVVIPALAGLKRTPGIVTAVCGVTIVGHSILWTAGIMGSYGMPRYLVTIVPALAICAAFGFEQFGAICTELRFERFWKIARATLFVAATAVALFVVWYRPNTFRGAQRLAEFRGVLTDHTTVARLHGGEWRRVDQWRQNPPGTPVTWESSLGSNEAFATIPKERREFEWSLILPPAWPWEKQWEGRIYRLK